ncbi:MAG: hypothetical protein ABSC94_21790 [Polyangiaceae bacterium]|jgi:hypothetical protein
MPSEADSTGRSSAEAGPADPPDRETDGFAGPPGSASAVEFDPRPGPRVEAGPPKHQVRCVRDATFPSTWLVPEASAAAQVELRPGRTEILVVGDSGRAGAAMAWRPGPEAPRRLVLPLDALASDDLEGMAWVSDASGGRLYTLTSSGAVRSFVADGAGGLRRASGAMAIGPPPLSCPDLHEINCGKNWEGLCLRKPGSRQRCAGYAASKAETALYCVLRDASGRLSIDPTRPPIELSLENFLGRRDILSDCAFGAADGPAEDVLLVTTNVFGGSSTYVVDESTGQSTRLELSSTPSNEAIAVDSRGYFYAFMDDNGEVSPAARLLCTGWRP